MRRTHKYTHPLLQLLCPCMVVRVRHEMQEGGQVSHKLSRAESQTQDLEVGACRQLGLPETQVLITQLYVLEESVRIGTEKPAAFGLTGTISTPHICVFVHMMIEHQNPSGSVGVARPVQMVSHSDGRDGSHKVERIQFCDSCVFKPCRDVRFVRSSRGGQA